MKNLNLVGGKNIVLENIVDFDDAVATMLFGGETIIDCTGQRFVYSPTSWDDTNPPRLYQTSKDRWVKARELRYPVYLLK